MHRKVILIVTLLTLLLTLVACEGDDGPEYLTEIVPACAPIEGAYVDPCAPGSPPAHFSPTGVLNGGPTAISWGHPPDSISRLLEGGSIYSVPHLVARGTFASGSVRCTIGNTGRDPAYVDDSEEGVQYIKCFADLQVREYILGTGPTSLSVEIDHFFYGPEQLMLGYADLVEDTTPTALEAAEWHRRVMENSVRRQDGLFTKELIHFLAPSHDLNMVAFKAWGQTSWGLERTEDDAILAIHPQRETFRSFAPALYTQHRSTLEIPLATFKTMVQNADRARRTANGGRIVPADHNELAPGATIPMLLQDANKLEQYFRGIGAYNQLNSQPKTAPPACGLGAVTNPSTNGWLMQACISLLEAKDSLRGTGSLNWSPTLAMSSWDGITIGTGFNIPTKGSGQPKTGSIVQQLSLSSKSLTGTIPEELDTLYGLTTLKLNGNSMTGSIPKSLGEIDTLTEIKLTGNSLTGCIPLPLKSVTTNDLSSLKLLYCRPPAPAGLSAGTAGETSVPLTWTAVANASKYRVEYSMDGVGSWTVDNASITGASHTVSGLACGSKRHVRVSAYGSGTVYATAWSDPSASVKATVGACVTPAFARASYDFRVPANARVKDSVGTVSATDPNGDTLTYSIKAGNNSGFFAINRGTGAITVAGRLTKYTFHTLTVQASDGTNTATATVTVTVMGNKCPTGMVCIGGEEEEG